MSHVLGEDLIYEVLSVVEEIPEGKGGLLRPDRPAHRAGEECKTGRRIFPTQNIMETTRVIGW